MSAQLLYNLKELGQHLNAANFFWLPPDTPYGNMQLKLMMIANRVDEANQLLVKLNAGVPTVNEIGFVLGLERYKYDVEYFVYNMRRVADETIAMICYLLKYTVDGQKALHHDSVGKFVAGKCPNELKSFQSNHVSFLSLLNDISNAYKHSFVNTDLTVLPSSASIVALGLRGNVLANGAVFYNVPITAVVDGFNAFFIDAVEWLRSYSEEHRN